MTQKVLLPRETFSLGKFKYVAGKVLKFMEVILMLLPVRSQRN